ncbi:MAG: murein biosynthesis integral membrane protein MurJ [Clostridia bacterium]|nr:murein biosynthesis integral membrane protein MurJ [Clostridia bacterium]
MEGIKNSDKKSIFASIGSVTLIMVISRLLSLVSVQVYIAFFGASDVYMNIYSYAISVPNIIFTCIGTALSTVVIPIYVEHRVANDGKADVFANNIITISMTLTAALVIIGIAVSPVLARLSGFGNNPVTYSYTVKALMMVMPVMFFYGLNYIFQGMLQSMGHYKMPAFVSVPSSCVVIAYVFLLSDRFGITGLLIATVIGLSLQAAILIPPLVRAGYRYKFLFNLKDEDFRRACKMTLPVLAGVGAYQLNMFYNVTMISRFEAMLTLLTMVQNIALYLVLALVYSVTAVVYPKLTERAALKDMAGYKKLLSGIVGMTSVILIPLTAGFIALGRDLLDLISRYGAMTQSDVERAALLLCAYSIGILGFGLKEILDRAFYSLKDTKTSALTGFAIMVINILLSLILMQFLGAYGIPLAFSIASLSGCALLMWFLRRRIGAWGSGIGATLLKSVLASAVMFAAIVVVKSFFGDTPDSVLWRAVRLFVPFFVAIAVYYTAAVAIGIEPVRELHGKLFGRKAH